jgi:hypothetical protein
MPSAASISARTAGAEFGMNGCAARSSTDRIVRDKRGRARHHARVGVASLIVDGTRGAIAGAVATWFMDLVTTALYEAQSEETTARERAAQVRGKGSVENLLERMESMTGVSVPQDMRPTALQALHYGLGIGPGALYGVLRGRVPGVGAGRGILYGLALFAVNDEFMNTALGLAGPPGAYPIETHWRGLVGHVVLGVATDAGVSVLGGGS